jgi:AraC-like DNA-binding protein
MNITFQKKPGDPTLGTAFFWRMTIEGARPFSLTDHFIPELFYDYFYIHAGAIEHNDSNLPRQTLKTLHTRPLTFTFSTPLILYGVRLSLSFAESYSQSKLENNSFLTPCWLTEPPQSLGEFETAVTTRLQTNRQPQNPYPMLTPAKEETNWLAAYSPRHKRRLYKATFGLSRKELDSIHSIQAFLEQTCDFAAENPRIIEYVNPEIFYDLPHLNHAFKKITGFSPLAYFEASSILQDNLMAASYNAASIR